MNVQKSLIKQIYKSNIIRDDNLVKQKAKLKCLTIQENNKDSGNKACTVNNTPNCFLILISMTDKTTFVEVFDGKDMLERGLIPEGVNANEYARLKRDERYDQLQRLIANQIF